MSKLGGKGGSNKKRGLVSCYISFYDNPPLYEIDFDKFKGICDKRLKLLRLIENYSENS